MVVIVASFQNTFNVPVLLFLFGVCLFLLLINCCTCLASTLRIYHDKQGCILICCHLNQQYGTVQLNFSCSTPLFIRILYVALLAFTPLTTITTRAILDSKPKIVARVESSPVYDTVDSIPSIRA